MWGSAMQVCQMQVRSSRCSPGIIRVTVIKTEESVLFNRRDGVWTTHGS